ncbi:MAG TPA: DUF1801 domain-containing protein [Dehalococcoidia bacterium]|jgi:uncharacterized protein YdhG (YjbR/CyaY superfamily)|nr:DUF1801 domain-containing protein [Dehalococcoidia bacterium]
MSPAPQTVDGCLAALPEEQRAALEKLRRTIKASAPEAVESISYGIPAFKYKGRSLAYFGAAKKHCALYGMSVMGAHEADLQPYDRSKGTVRFAPDKPLTATLVKKLVDAQMKEIEAGASGYAKK